MNFEKWFVKARIEPIVASQSMVAYIHGNKEFPRSSGNYFSFPNRLRCVNMWAENLKEALYRRIILDKIEVEIFTNDPGFIKFASEPDVDMYRFGTSAMAGFKRLDVFGYCAVVIDKRLNPEWTNKNPCFTGCGTPYNTPYDQWINFLYNRYGWQR